MAGKSPRAAERKRLDLAVVERNLAPSREKAQALIMAGEVWIDGQPCLKADRKVAAENEVTVRRRYPYASRGAYKIAEALTAFALDVRGLHVLDIGISNGGFADYLLQMGAGGVTGVDVNIAQVDERLRRDPRVTLIEKNARLLTAADFPHVPDLVVMDVSFISVGKILPALTIFPAARFLVMVKPQFEAERGQVGKGGVIRDPERVEEILSRLRRDFSVLGFHEIGMTPAGIKGKKGNQEYFFLLRCGAAGENDGTISADEA